MNARGGAACWGLLAACWGLWALGLAGGCDTSEDRPAQRGALAVFYDAFQKSPDKGEPSEEDRRGACVDLCPGMRDCVNAACGSALLPSSCGLLCESQDSLDRPACARIQGAVAGEPALCDLVRTSAVPDAAPPSLQTDAGVDTCGLMCACVLQCAGDQACAEGCAIAHCGGEEDPRGAACFACLERCG